MDKAVICQLELEEEKVRQFKDAIENSYWFEFFMGTFVFSYIHTYICTHTNTRYILVFVN